MTPGVDAFGNDGLATAIVDMDVPHDLFATAPHAGERFHLPLRGAQELRGEIPEHLRSLHPFGFAKLGKSANRRVMGYIHLHQQQCLGLGLRLHAFDKRQRGIVAPVIVCIDRA
ncbi:hypothetical protein C7E20_09470 [Sphingobium sp. AEW4]|nr:hypothetical protein C7E20_09470 [Sphingobium sp. AEW4]